MPITMVLSRWTHRLGRTGSAIVALLIVAAVAITVIVLRSDDGTVVVSGTDEWTDTGIDLNAEDWLEITATGEVFHSVDFGLSTGPDGNPDEDGLHPDQPLPDEHHAALIGVISPAGDEPAGTVFLVGSEWSGQAGQEGRLYLGINDEDVSDNDGEFTATVTVNP